MLFAHLHLLLNHLPIIGSALGLMVLLFAIRAGSAEAETGAYLILIVSGLGAIGAFATGEDAEAAVKGIDGISKALIHTHEDFALWSLIFSGAAGAGSAAGIFLNRKRHALAPLAARIVAALAFLGFILSGITGYHGGKIRHTELYRNPPADGSASDPR